MTNNTVNIVLRVEGSDAAVQSVRKVTGALSGLGDAGQALARLDAGLNRVADSVAKVGHYGIGLGIVAPRLVDMVRSTASAADGWASLTARVRLASDGLGSAAQAQQQLFSIAQESRTPVADLVTVYQRMANAGQELGLSQQFVLEVTQTLAKAMALSGGNAQSASAALVQLGQGLAAGTLRGEELNSVLEQAPRLAKALADGMGLPIGALKLLGEQGKITAEAIFTALSRSKAQLEREFAQLPQTIDGALTQLSNSFMRTIGVFDETNKVSQAAAESIKALADNMGTALVVGSGLAVTIALLRSSGTAAALATGALGVGVAALANPLGLVALLLAGGVVAWKSWGRAGVESEKSVERQFVESDAEIIERIDGQIKKLKQRNDLAAKGLPSERNDADAARAGAIYARLYAQSQRALNAEGEYATLAGNEAARRSAYIALMGQAAQAYSAYVGAAEAATERAEKAGDKLIENSAGAVKLDLDIKKKWYTDAVDIAKNYQGAIDLAEGDPSRQASLVAERNQRLIDGQKATTKALKDLALARSADARALADANAAYDLQSQENTLQAGLRQIEQRDAYLQAIHSAGLIELRDYYAQKNAIELDQLGKEDELLREQIRKDLRTSATDAAAIKARDTRVLGLTGKLQANDDKRQVLRQQPALAAEIEVAAAERKGIQEQEQAIYDARTAALQFGKDLTEANREAGIAMIRDDRERGLAQIELERERMLKQIAPLEGLAGRYAEEYAKVNEAVRLKTAQLTEQLKPEWQRQAELWADNLRDMARRKDEFLQGFVDRGRDAFAEFVATGRLSTQSLVGFIRAEFARLAYEKFLAQYVRGAANSLFDVFLGGAKGGTGGGGNASFGDLIALDSLPPRALGGPVAAGATYLVGERGPELLRMGAQGGYVVPNERMARVGTGAGAGVQIVQHFSIRGNEDPRTLRALATQVRQETMAALADARSRGNRAFA